MTLGDGGKRASRSTPSQDRPIGVEMRPVILICDDEQAVRALVRAALAAEGYELYEACDGDELVSCARSLQPDVIILDMTMPGGSGLEALAVLRRDPGLPQPRVILATAWAGMAEESAADAVGVDRFLTKPFTIGELRATVRELAEAETVPEPFASRERLPGRARRSSSRSASDGRIDLLLRRTVDTAHGCR
ncbi:MAG: response regulator [Gaiellaceae bacterium]